MKTLDLRGKKKHAFGVYSGMFIKSFLCRDTPPYIPIMLLQFWNYKTHIWEKKYVEPLEPSQQPIPQPSSFPNSSELLPFDV